MDISGYTAEQIRQMPELAHLYEVVLFLEKNKNTVFFPEKYEASILEIAEEDTHELFEQQPTMPLKNVIAAIVPTFSTELSGELILKVTKKIVQTWQERLEMVHFQENALEMA
jgi:hypothetical protein